MKQLITLISVSLASLLLLTACGSPVQKSVPGNPYTEQMKTFSRNGVAAMQRERWLVAEKLFERALRSAQLANRPNLIAQAWYNLGSLYISADDDEKGERALKRALSIAEQQQLEITYLRAKTALALLYQRAGERAWQPDILNATMPLDLHLSTARLAQMQERYDVARYEYRFVLNGRSPNRASMLYKVEAHMGLALIAAQLQTYETAKKEIESVLSMSRNIGAPRLAAHALLLRAEIEESANAKQSDLQDALAIYRALKDVRGEKDVLIQLKAIAERE